MGYNQFPNPAVAIPVDPSLQRTLIVGAHLGTTGYATIGAALADARPGDTIFVQPGEYEENLYFSIRTSDRRMNAGRLIREVIEAKGGSAGGHGTMAGARLGLKGLGQAAARRLRDELVRDFLDAFGIRARKPKKLV